MLTPDDVRGVALLNAYLDAERDYARTPARPDVGEAEWVESLKRNSLAFAAARCDLEDFCRHFGPTWVGTVTARIGRGNELVVLRDRPAVEAFRGIGAPAFQRGERGLAC